MSLLMDALRKAEEAKKQAEQEKLSEHVSSQQAVVAETDDIVPNVPPAESEEPSSRDLNVMIEFEDEAADIAAPIAAPSTSLLISEDLNKAVESVSLKLDAALPKRPSISEESDNLGAKNTDDVESFFAAQEISSGSTTPPETPELELPIELTPSAVEAPLAQATKAGSDRSIDYSTGAQKSISEISAHKESGSEKSKSSGNNWQDPVSSISERTAKSRQSAKSVFAAKNISSKNKKAFLYGGAGITVIAILAVGYFVLSSGSSSTGFNIPQDYYVSSSEAEYLSGNSGNIERVNTGTNDAQVEEEVVLDSASAIGPAVEAAIELQSAESIADDPQIAMNEQPVLGGLSMVSTLSLPPAQLNATDSNANPILETIEPVTEASMPLATTATIPQDQPASAEVEPDSALIGNAENAQSVPDLDLISFRRKETNNVVSPQLTRAYAAYQAGNLDGALALYNQVLANEPRNIDALLGKAAISSAQGDSAQAMSLYSTVLSLNPSQAIARSGLLSLAPTVNASDQERQLRSLINEYPGVAPLAFALGNFYASQSRWIDAQRHYFNALSLAKTDSASGAQISPDYAFNLAVSLDRLNQPGPAAKYYIEALNLASQFPANFDLEIARVRINKLSVSDSP